MLRTLSILISLAFFALYAQTQNFQWALKTGGGSLDYSTNLITDSQGNVYNLGIFSGTVDLDPGPGIMNQAGFGSRDIFLQKLDPAGNMIWAKAFGGTGFDQVDAIKVDGNGDLIVIGAFRNTVDFDPGPGTFNLTSQGQSDIFILKLDANGNFIWVKSMGAGDRDNPRALEVNAANELTISGSFNDTVDFDPGPGTQFLTSVGSYDGFILRLDGGGNFIWAKSNQGADFNSCWSVWVDPLGNSYLTGDFAGTVDFDPGPGVYNLTSNGSADIFLQKLDASGNFVWVQQFGSTAGDYGSSVLMGVGNDLYHCGIFSGTVDFDPGPAAITETSAGGYDIFIRKIDPVGNLTWSKRIGGTGDEYVEGVVLDQFESIYITGGFMDVVDFDPGPGTTLKTSNGDKDFYVLKLDPSANFRWVHTGGSSNRDWGASITLGPQGDIYSNGLFSNTVDFDPSAATYNLTSSGNWDSYIQKFDNCFPTSSVVFVQHCGTYTSPSGNYSWDSSGVYNDTIASASGCDSTMIIRLTVDEAVVNTLIDSACGTYSLNGQTYTTTGQYQQILTASNGCDSTIDLDLTILSLPTAGFTWTQIQNNSTFTNSSQQATSWLWDFGDGLQSTLENPTHTYQQNGTYLTCLTVTSADGCTHQYCDSISFFAVGKPDPLALEGIEIFPNPNSGLLKLKSPITLKDASMSVYNAQGALVLVREETLYRDETIELDLSELANGPYLVQLNGDHKVVTKRILLQR